MKKPNVEVLKLNVHTQPIGRTELLRSLRLPDDAAVLVDGRRIEEVSVQWVEKDANLARLLGSEVEERPILQCPRCERRVRGKGPFKCHMDWHAQNDAAAKRRAKKPEVKVEPGEVKP